MRVAPWLALVVLAACTGKDGPSLGTGSDAFTTVTSRLSTAISTVAIVEWTVDGSPTREWVEYGGNTGYGQEAPADASGHAVLAGVAPETAVHFRVGAELDGETIYSSDYTYTTGSIPADIPDRTVTDADPTADFGSFILTSYFAAGPGESGVIVLNRDGDVVWYTEPQDGFMPAVRPARDGRSVYYLWDQSVVDTETARICKVDLTGENEACTNHPYAHHDFVELEDGSLVFAEETVEEFRGFDLIGDQLVKVDDAGSREIVWNAFDDITPVQESWWQDHILPRGVDWTHVNGIWHDEAEDDWYISFYFFQEVRKVPAATGRTEWILGGDDSDFVFQGTEFGPQHAPQITTDGRFAVFDNASGGPSMAAIYTLDTSSNRATLDHSYPHPEDRRATVLGDAHVLDNGYVATAFGDVGAMYVFSPQGQVAWSYLPEAGVSSTQVYPFDSMYAMDPDYD